MPEEFIHKPWEFPNKDVVSKNYPNPIVNHQVARESALNAFKKIKKID